MLVPFSAGKAGGSSKAGASSYGAENLRNGLQWIARYELSDVIQHERLWDADGSKFNLPDGSLRSLNQVIPSERRISIYFDTADIVLGKARFGFNGQGIYLRIDYAHDIIKPVNSGTINACVVLDDRAITRLLVSKISPVNDLCPQIILEQPLASTTSDIGAVSFVSPGLVLSQINPLINGQELVPIFAVDSLTCSKAFNVTLPTSIAAVRDEICLQIILSKSNFYATNKHDKFPEIRHKLQQATNSGYTTTRDRTIFGHSLARQLGIEIVHPLVTTPLGDDSDQISRAVEILKERAGQILAPEVASSEYRFAIRPKNGDAETGYTLLAKQV